MYTSRESVEMFALMGVMSRKELEARNEVKWEIYTKKIQIEARVLGDLAAHRRGLQRLPPGGGGHALLAPRRADGHRRGDAERHQRGGAQGQIGRAHV